MSHGGRLIGGQQSLPPPQAKSSMVNKQETEATERMDFTLAFGLAHVSDDGDCAGSGVGEQPPRAPSSRPSTATVVAFVSNLVIRREICMPGLCALFGGDLVVISRPAAPFAATVLPPQACLREVRPLGGTPAATAVSERG